MSKPASKSSLLSRSAQRSLIVKLLHTIRHMGYPNRLAFAKLDQAALPAQVDHKIRSTIKKTKLWASEREEIVLELITHALDAIESGRAADEIAQSFGDPKRVAKLLRRSMKRKRPLYWRAYRNMKRATGVVIVLVVIGYGSLAVRFYTGKPEIKRNFIAELNARNNGYAEDQKAWGVYQEIDIAWQRHIREEHAREKARFDAVRFKEFARDEDAPVVYGPGIDEYHTITTAHPDYQGVVDRFISFANEFEKLRNAAHRPIAGMVYSHQSESIELEPGVWSWRVMPPESDPKKQSTLVEVLLPHLGMMRRFTNMLVFDMKLALESGDSARAFDDLRAMIGIADQANQEGFMISSLVAIAIDSVVMERTQDMLRQYPDAWTRDQLVELAHASTSMQSRRHMSFETESMMFDDMLQRSFTDDGNGNGRMTSDGMYALTWVGGMVPNGQDRFDSSMGFGELVGSMTQPLSLVLMEDRKTQYRNYYEMVDSIERVIEQGPRSIGQLTYLETRSDARAQKTGVMNSFADLLVPALSSAANRVMQAQVQLDAFSTMLAIETYRRDHAQLPQSLELLVPRYLPKVPADPFNPGYPLQYQIDGAGYIVYAAGSDGDLDGGVQIESDTAKSDSRSFVKRYPPKIGWRDETPFLARDESGQSVLLDPQGPDSDWVLIDMRTDNESLSTPIED